jgi:2-dehydro-3-deoxyphosphogluconate aldolase / (4S)-4-hydroxy-2-oxoglutarate aldolase
MEQQTAHHQFLQQIKKAKLLPLFYHADAIVCRNTMRALYDAGIRVIEFTNRGEAAEENFRTMVNERNKTMPDLLLAVGTVCNSADVISFCHIGADVLVSPFYDSSVAAMAKFKQKLWIPGCMTPGEIHRAKKDGCHFIKLFPGNLLSPSFITAVAGIFPDVDFMVTGGVEPTKESLQAWFNAGAAVVGMGGSLISKKMMEGNDFDGIKKITAETIETIKTITTP